MSKYWTQNWGVKGGKAPQTGIVWWFPR